MPNESTPDTPSLVPLCGCEESQFYTMAMEYAHALLEAGLTERAREALQKALALRDKHEAPPILKPLIGG